MKISWTRMKWRIDNQGLPFHYEEIASGGYYIWGDVAGEHLDCKITGSSDITEFENDYKSDGNKPTIKIEPDTGLWRVRNRDVEGTLDLVEVQFITGNSGSLEQDDATYYSIDTNTSGLTKIKFTPPSAYYIRGGYLKCISDLTTEVCKARFVIAPNLPSQYGNPWPFIRNISICKNDPVFDKTFPSKYVQYITGLVEASECELQLSHDSGYSLKFKFWLDVYR